MFSYTNAEPDLSGYTVLLPSMGVGNVAQLVIDVLVSTLKMEKVAIVWHSAMVPIIGPNAFDKDSDDPTSACELFLCRAAKLAVLQLRAPIAPSRVGEFFAQMFADFANQHIARLLVLTSSYAYEKHQVDSPPFEYLTNDAYAGSSKYFGDELGWTLFTGDTIFGGGFAKRVLNIAQEVNIPAALLFKYVSEGDNSTDMPDMCDRIDRFLGGILPKGEDGRLRLVSPVSWKLLFGNSAPEQLY